MLYIIVSACIWSLGWSIVLFFLSFLLLWGVALCVYSMEWLSRNSCLGGSRPLLPTATPRRANLQFYPHYHPHHQETDP